MQQMTSLRSGFCSLGSRIFVGDRRVTPRYGDRVPRATISEEEERVCRESM